VTRHLYRCPLRWADMDQLGHVNNVTYVDYLQEARVDMLRAHAPVSGGEELAEGVVVVKHEVDYRRPLVYREEPVSIDAWVTKVSAASFTLAYEIYDEDESGERTVYVQARSLLAPYVFTTESPRRLTDVERATLTQLSDDAVGPKPREGRLSRDSGTAWRHRYDCHVRFSDVDLYRHVNNVKYFEYVQEARIAMVGEMVRRADVADAGLRTPQWRLVVGAIDVEYSRPLMLRQDPYPIDSWVERVGRSSFVVASEISDGEQVLARARAVMVTFDPETQHAVPLSDAERAALTATA
jgi:acyl-CoA thioester hydrolase